MSKSTPAILYYVHDPMCSWCWGFREEWLKVKQQLPSDLQLVSLVGGLAPDSDTPMPTALQADIKAAWQRIQQVIPGTKFNFDFWTKNTPRRSTYPACRAVIAARQLGNSESKMTLGIQQAYYLNAKNPSDLDTLLNVAKSIGLDGADFESLMNSTEIHDLLSQELERVRSIGVYSFPSVVLQLDSEFHTIKLEYTDSEKMLAEIKQLLLTH